MSFLLGLDPIVQAAIVTVGGMILIQFFVFIQRKNDSRERFLYEIYPRRLAIYEEIIKELHTIVGSSESMLDLRLTKESACKKIEDRSYWI